MLELSLHVLDIAENSTRAEAKHICITIRESLERDLLTLEIRDDGVGMTEETLANVLDPFYTTKKVRRVGLGLPMLAEQPERPVAD
jgi:signal transduction histidine kinase